MTLAARALDGIRMYALLAGAGLRAQMQYRTSFWIRTATDFAGLLAEFLPVVFLVDRFGAVQGWTLPELAILYGMVGVSWALVELGLHGFEEFGRYLGAGELDQWLLRPRGIVLQVAASHFEPHRVARVAQAAVVLAFGVIAAGAGAASLAWIAAGIAGGIFFFSGVVMLGAASQFWTLGQTSELQNVLTYGGTAALAYPVSIYETWFRRVLTFGVPLAFVNYFPALAALDRTSAAGFATFVPWLSPLVCLAVAALGVAAFRRGLRRYESTGT